jgi:hypothetical protein
MAQATFAQHATVTQDGQGNPFLVYTGQGGNTLYEINSLGNVVVASGITAAGSIGQPIIVGSYTASLAFGLFVTSGAVAINLLPSTAPAGLYNLSIYSVISTSFSGNSVATVPITVGWTDSVHSQTNALLAGGTLTANFFQQGNLVIDNGGTAAVTITPSATTGNPTAGAMSVYAVITRLM